MDDLPDGAVSYRERMGQMCTAPDCDRSAKAAGYCAAHYQRTRRGQPLDAPVRRAYRGKLCQRDGCERPARSLGLCVNHYGNYRRCGDPAGMFPESNGARHGVNNPSWGGDEVSYGAIHYRLRRYRGRACDHVCIVCGGTADEWAYAGSRTDRVSEEGCEYGPDLSDYVPQCRPCHKTFDIARRIRHAVATYFG